MRYDLGAISQSGDGSAERKITPAVEDDLPDEYDFTTEQLRNGIMGKYVGRFTEQIRGFAAVLRERQTQQEQTRRDEAA